MTLTLYSQKSLWILIVSTLLSITFLSSCTSQSESSNDSIKVYHEFGELEERIAADTTNIWVINFWATTCPPCLKEMPHFKELEDKYADKQMKVLLINLDEFEDLETRVIPFIKKYNIEPEVVMLSDINYNVWTDFVDKSWYGALPATLILHSGHRKFKFGAYPTFDALEADFKPFLDF